MILCGYVDIVVLGTKVFVASVHSSPGILLCVYILLYTKCTVYEVCICLLRCEQIPDTKYNVGVLLAFYPTPFTSLGPEQGPAEVASYPSFHGEK